MSLIKKVSIGSLLLSLLSLSGYLEHSDDVLAEKRYCKMVEAGLWGEYKEGINCNKTSEEK